ncbi:hotdog domain-containing protein [Micromonospora sp. WMMA1363]|uniref:PaaI family thioesterase n=1 Tax=Micromonospora sp. WMMA1363 TaxID=3053985 RepID=UPI00259CDA23|nr:hotdog domain-containing protein [Micromonospora sp. WMMA1363]MDM4719430.1 hotdog domain-containing protein [Micromonospora sp. WMMA1363]
MSRSNDERWRSHHPTRERRADSPSLLDRREAIAELGDALRDLVEQAAATEAPADQLRQVATEVRGATRPLATHERERARMPSADDLLGGVRMYNPVTGAGSALAPPLRIDLVDGVAIGACTLGLAFEGPPTYAHGGVSALLLDQMLGYAASATGHAGMTIRLDTRYHAPVPLRTPLRLTARVTAVSGRRTTAHGVITTAAQPGDLLVEATGEFVAPRPDQSRRLFGAALHPDAIDPSVEHD